MGNPDYAAAREYVRARLRDELPADLTYHNYRHTLEDVVPAVERLGRMAALDDHSRLMLTTAALFHDTGFLQTYRDHETASIAIARAELPRFGYDPDQIEQVASIIGATRMPQRPSGRLQELMCDADLDLLGRDDFWRLNQELLLETRCYSPTPPGDEEWFCAQIKFLAEHRFFSPEARKLRDDGKVQNRLRLRDALTVLYESNEAEGDPCLPWRVY